MLAKHLLVAAVLSAGVVTEMQVETAPPPREVASPKTFAFEMRDQPWHEVLDWYHNTAGLTPIYTVSPTGKFTHIPPKDKRFTLGEITDILNDELAKQKLLLIRRQVSFTIVRTDEKIDLSLVPRSTLGELPERGDTELVQVLRPLKTLAAEGVAPEVNKLLTPLGKVSVLRNGTLVVMDTAGNLRRIHWLLMAWEDPENVCFGQFLTRRLIYAKAEDVAKKLEALLAVAAPGRVRDVAATADPKTNTVTITAPAAKLELARKLIDEWDRRSIGDSFPKPGDPELRKYRVPSGTAEAVAKLLQTSSPTMRVLALPNGDEILVLGPPDEHFEVAELLKG